MVTIVSITLFSSNLGKICIMRFFQHLYWASFGLQDSTLSEFGGLVVGTFFRRHFCPGEERGTVQLKLSTAEGVGDGRDMAKGRDEIRFDCR